MSDNNTIRVQISVDGISALTDAINRLTATIGQEQVAPVAAATGTTESQSIPAQLPTQQAAPAAQTTSVPLPVGDSVPTPQVPTPIPTSAVVNQYTRDQLAVAASGLINMGKQQRLLEILHGFGVQALTELPENMYGAFAGAIKVEGAVI